MTLFVFLLATAAGGGGVVALRERPKTAAAIGLLATVVCLLPPWRCPRRHRWPSGSTTLQVDAYVRLFLIAASVSGCWSVRSSAWHTAGNVSCLWRRSVRSA
jgi:hypothetical protein